MGLGVGGAASEELTESWTGATRAEPLAARARAATARRLRSARAGDRTLRNRIRGACAGRVPMPSPRLVFAGRGVVADPVHPGGGAAQGVDQVAVGRPQLHLEEPGRDDVHAVVGAADLVGCGEGQGL